MSYFGGHPNGDLFLPCFLAVGGVVAESTRGRDRTDADMGDGGVTTRLPSWDDNSSSDSDAASLLSCSSRRELAVRARLGAMLDRRLAVAGLLIVRVDEGRIACLIRQNEWLGAMIPECPYQCARIRLVCLIPKHQASVSE